MLLSWIEIGEIADGIGSRVDQSRSEQNTAQGQEQEREREDGVMARIYNSGHRGNVRGKMLR